MANTTIDILRNLRQSRAFADKPISDTDLQSILEVARWTGSAGNSQPWHLVIVRDRDTLQHFAPLHQYISWLKDSPLVIAVAVPNELTFPADFDEGRIAERIMLAASVLDLASGLVWVPVEDRQPVHEALGVPDTHHVQTVVAIGHPEEGGDKRPAGPGRKPLAEIVSFERFGQKP